MLTPAWRRRLKISLIALLLVELLLWAAPPLLRGVVASEAGRLLHRPVSIGQLSLNPLTMTLRIGELTIKGQQGEPLLAFDELRVNANLPGSIRHRGVVIDAIELRHPRLHLARTGDNRYNISDLIEEFLNKPDDGEKARFSLNNLQLDNGEIHFDDLPAHSKQSISQLRLTLPFISNLPYLADQHVQPGLSALINGARLEAQAKARPFSNNRESRLEINLQDVDLTHYLGYLPMPPQFKLASAKLDSRLTLDFSQAQDQPPSIKLAGQLSLRQLQMQQLDGTPLLAWDKATLDIARLEPLQQHYQMQKLVLQRPSLQLQRNRQGQINLLQAFAHPADKSHTAKAEPKAGAAAGKKPALQLSLQQVQLQQGQLGWQDASTGFATDITSINAQVDRFELRPGHPARFQLQLHTSQQEQLTAHGQFRLQPFGLQGELQLQQLALAHYAALLRPHLPLRISQGRLDVGGKLDFANNTLQLQQLALALSKLHVLPPQGNKAVLTLDKLNLADGRLDLAQQQLDFGQISSSGLQLQLKRDAEGKIDWQQWLQRKPQPAAAPGKPWSWHVGQLALDNYALSFTDEQPVQPASLKLSQLQIKAQDIGPKQAIPLELRTRINRGGNMAASGKLQLQPLSGELKLQLSGIDLLPLQPYFTEKLNISLTRGQLNAAGQLRFAQRNTLSGSYQGNLGIDKLASIDKKYGQDFLNWKTLQITGIKASDTQAQIEQISLSDFYSRLQVNTDGRLNLLDIATQPAGPARTEVASNTPAAVATTEKPEPFPLQIKKVKLSGGNIQFSDYFIRPNYSANMTQIGGSITGLSTRADSRASMELLGSVNNNAQFSLAGNLNPLAKDLYLDIKAGIKGFEMIPASPYSGKYAGYGIQKGKLSMEISYFVENRHIKALNHLFVDQFTFGEKTDSPDATSLPVQLAVSLLQNRRGEIDINLPIEGSLDDPELKVGRIVIQMLKNLLEKAVTAPFALLTGGSGGEELSYIDFEPGSSTLTPAAQGKLATLAKALGDRPSLKLEIAGHADLQTDATGLKKLALEQKVRAQKLRHMAQLGQAADDTVKISAEEYPALLKAAYKAEDFKKPRTMLGLQKDLPVAEMQALMLANIDIQPDDVRQLANRRAFAAKNALLQAGQIDDARLFIVAGKPGPAPDKASPGRVDFSLTGG